VQKQTHFSASPRSGPEALRRAFAQRFDSASPRSGPEGVSRDGNSCGLASSAAGEGTRRNKAAPETEQASAKLPNEAKYIRQMLGFGKMDGAPPARRVAPPVLNPPITLLCKLAASEPATKIST
jgi:hypothetical protein